MTDLHCPPCTYDSLTNSSTGGHLTSHLTLYPQLMQSKGADLQLCDSCLMGEGKRSGHILAVCLMATQTPVIGLKWFWQKINLEIQNSFGEKTCSNLHSMRMCNGQRGEMKRESNSPFKNSSLPPSPACHSQSGSLALVVVIPTLESRCFCSTVNTVQDAGQLSLLLPKCHVSTTLYEMIANMLLAPTNSTV